MIRRGERGIWQRRYWEHTIRDEQDFAAHMNYVHFIPVKHGLVENPAEWPRSAFRHCVAGGLYPTGWVLSRSVLEFIWRGLRLEKDIRSGSEVNRLVSELMG